MTTTTAKPPCMIPAALTIDPDGASHYWHPADGAATLTLCGHEIPADWEGWSTTDPRREKRPDCLACTRALETALRLTEQHDTPAATLRSLAGAALAAATWLEQADSTEATP